MSPLVAKDLTWLESPKPDERLRELMRAWVNLKKAGVKSAGSKRAFVVFAETFVAAVESCADGIKPDFLPAVFAPLFNTTGSFPRRQISEQFALRSLEYLRENGYPVPQGELQRGKPVRTPEEQQLYVEQQSASRKRRRQEKNMSKMREALGDTEPEEDDAPDGEGEDGDDDGEGEDGEGAESPDGEDETDVPPMAAQLPPAGRPSQTRAQAPKEQRMSGMEGLPPAAVKAAKQAARMAGSVQGWVQNNEKLRLWKRNAQLGEKDIHLKDFPGSIVEKYAGLSEFFDQVVRPTFGPFAGQADVVYYVARVTPNGAESAKVEYPMGASQISVPELGLGAAPGQPVASPPFHPGPQLPPATTLPGAVLEAARTINELDERRYQQTQEMLMRQQGRPTNEREQYEQRIRELENELEARRNAPPPAPQFNGNDGAVAALGEIALRAQQQAFNPPAHAAPAPVVAAPGMPSFMEMMQLMQNQQNATILLMRELMPKTDPNEMPPAMERLVDKVMTRMEKLEERLAANEGPGELDRMVHSLRVFQTLTGGDTSKPVFAPAQQSDSGFMGLMKGFVEKLPETLREYQNTVRTVAAVQHGLSPEAAVDQQRQMQAPQQPRPLPPPQPAAPRQPTDVELAAIAKRNRRERLPIDLRVAIEKLIVAPTPQLQIEAFVDLQGLFIDISEKEAKAQEAARAVGRAIEPSPLADISKAVGSRFEVATDLEAESEEELAKKRTAALAARNDLKAYFAGLFDWIGYGAEATGPKVAEIVENYFMAVDAELAKEDADGGDDDGDDEAGDEPAEEEAHVTPAPAAADVKPSEAVPADPAMANVVKFEKKLPEPRADF